MSFPRFSVFLLPLVCLAAQAPPPKPSTTSPPAAKQGPAVKVQVEEPAAELPAVPPDKVVVTIGDEKITAAEWARIVDALPKQYQNAARGPARRQFAENIVKIRLLAREARRLKVDQDPIVQERLLMQADNLLATYYFSNLASKAKVDGAEARQYYDQHKADYERVRVRHILIRMKGSPLPVKPDEKDITEEEALAKAQDLREKLVAGANFATLAKSESDDPGSASKGGELGFFKHGQMVPSFDEAAFKLPVGQISEPVKTQFGYHLIQVEQRETKSFEEVLPELEKELKPEVAQRQVEELQKQSNVTLDDSYFGTK